MGVAAIRRDDLKGALDHMEQALVLNPSHSQTREQVTNLRRALAASI